MKQKLLFIFLLFFCFYQGQTQTVIGTVVGEDGHALNGITIYNTRSEQKVVPDQKGDFIIDAKLMDELRVFKEGYEMQYIKISKANFEQPLKILLIRNPIDIDEVKLSFQATGNLKNDMAFLKENRKKAELNETIRMALKSPRTDVPYANQVPSAFKTHDFSAGQVSLFDSNGGGLLGLVAKSIFGKKTKPVVNQMDTKVFYQKIKEVVDLDYFYQHGLDEYDFGIFLVYADKKMKLSERYAYNFNPKMIESDLKVALVEFLKTHKTHG